jgi:CxxC motif-containing protein
MFECMEIINNTVVTLPARVGDVILEDVFGSRVVVTANKDVE